jgi:hypothetical protein
LLLKLVLLKISSGLQFTTADGRSSRVATHVGSSGRRLCLPLFWADRVHASLDWRQRSGRQVASRYIKTVNIFGLTLAPFEHFIVNFSKSYPFKGPRAGHVWLFWLDSSRSHWVDAETDSPPSESTWNETARQLSQCGVRLHVNWVNEEYCTPTFTKISSFRIDSVDVESHSALTQLTWSLTPRWLSWREVSLGFEVAFLWIRLDR